jgi:hypothetical protein
MHRFLGAKKPSVTQEDMDEVLVLGRKAGIDDIESCYETLKILAICREAISGEVNGVKLLKSIKEYMEKYPDKYHFKVIVHHDIVRKSRFLIKYLVKILVRDKPEYRFIDKIALNKFIYFLYRLFPFVYKKELPGFVNKEAMRMDVIFK